MRIATNNLIVMGIATVVYILVDFFIFASDAGSFFGILLLQLGLIAVAVSPIGEAILRFIYGSKPLTKREAERIMPLFNAVYQRVLEEHPDTNKAIKLYVENTMSVNAFAVGCRTITITRGAIETLSDDEIKGMLAHEFGHLAHGDTVLPLVFLVGNAMFLALMVAVKIAQLFVVFLTAYAQALFLGRIVNLLVTLLMTLALFVVQALILVNQRKNEYLADKFAYEIGYGADLLGVLYAISQFQFEGKTTMLDRIKSSHPNTRNRINRLEEMLER